MPKKKEKATIKIYDDRKAHKSSDIVIILPATWWPMRNKIADTIKMILEGNTHAS